MCQSKANGGARCAAYTGAALKAAKVEAVEASRAVDASFAMAGTKETRKKQAERAVADDRFDRAREALFHAHVTHASTTAGRREYEAIVAGTGNVHGMAKFEAERILQRAADQRERAASIRGAIRVALRERARRA